MIKEPDVDLVTYLASQVPLCVGENLFAGPVQPADPDDLIAHKAVFVVATGGIQPFALHGDCESIRRSNLQVRVRGEKEAYTEGLLLAREVAAAVDLAPITGYIDVRILDTEPNYLGQDDEGHPEWSVNVEMMHGE